MKSLLGLIAGLALLNSVEVKAHDNYHSLLRFISSNKIAIKFPSKNQHQNFPSYLAQLQVSKKGIKIPIIEAKEGDVLAFDGERWVPTDLTDVIGEGLVGPMGPAGAQGLKGDKGDMGDVGAIGPQGIIGTQGAKGDIGAQGAAGIAGVKGDKGETGSQGAAGIAGAKGDKGETGSQGADGIAGAIGPQGLMGLMGLDGLAGAKGDKGDPGAAGAMGPQGLMGLMGLDGLAGAKGDKGDAGAAGEMGQMGLQGMTGLQGEKGDKGDAGRDANLYAGTNPGDMVQLDQDGRIPASVMPVVAVTNNAIQIAFIKDIRLPDVDGGDCLALTWMKRTLNTHQGDTSFMSLNNNQFTLEPGEYLIEGRAPAFQIASHRAKIVLASTGETILVGSSARSHATNATVSDSFFSDYLIVHQRSAFEMYHYCTKEYLQYGLGVATRVGEPEVYTQLKIQKVK